VEEFPGNSQRRPGPREEAPAVEKHQISKVVTGEVIQRKKPLGKRLRETYFGGDDNRTIVEHVVEDVVVPMSKDLLYDAFTSLVGRRIYGDNMAPMRRAGRPGLPGIGAIIDPRNNTNYNSISRGGRPDDRAMSKRARATHDFSEIILPTRPEAEAVLTGLFDILEQYDQVPLTDLYELVGVSANFTDQRYGWTDLRGSSVRRIREGYLLELPRPEVLGR
jgi:hypothetical protein